MSPIDEHHVLRNLLSAWHEINRLHLGEGLKPPVIELTDAEKTLGVWRTQSRTIAISKKLIHKHPWPYIVDVLKHEMAHQYVDEVLRPEGETAHGPAFRRVCGQLGIPAKASATEADKDNLVIKRIQRLLRLGESTNEHEATAAMRKAKELLERYKIDHLEASERPDYLVRYFGKPKSRLSAVEKVLAGMLARDFFVAAIWVPGGAVDGRPTKLLEISGRGHHVELAEHVYHFLLNTVEDLWKQARKTHGYRGQAQKRRFSLGVLSGFSDQRTCTSQEHHELVLLHEQQLNGFIKRRHPRLRAGRRTRVVCDEAYDQGRSRGSRITIRPPIDSKAPSATTRAKPRLITARQLSLINSDL